jgi:hypothetical protein
MYLIFLPTGGTPVACVGSVATVTPFTILLDAGKSMILERYNLDNGVLTDLYPAKTDEEVMAIIEANRPTSAPTEAPKTTAPVSKLDFMNRFTMDELTGIYTAAKTIVPIEVFLDKLKMTTSVLLTDENTVSGINALVAAKLLTEARAAEILA